MKRKKRSKKIPKYAELPVKAFKKSKAYLAKFWNTGFWQKIIIILTVIVLAVTTVMYSVAQWYIIKHRNEPVVIGATFIPNYVRHFELEPKETLDAIINDLGVKDLRFVSYWSTHEAEQGVYDFSELDWQFEMAEQNDAKVSLSIGLRQPRWPECHSPTWVEGMSQDEWYPKLKDYITATVERYKDHPSLVSYQLENEFLLAAFGHCPGHERERLIDEFKLVKSIDPHTTLITSRSNNAVPSWPMGEPRSDINAASIYKRVWDGNVTGRYYEYPLPAWFYAFLAGGAELTTGRNTFIHELQAEPWTPPGAGGNRDSSMEELDKSFSAEDVEPRIHYALDTGMKTMYLWGVEWYYFLKEKRDSPEHWNQTKIEILKHNGKVYK